MLKIWKYNTFIFLVQIMTAMIVYYATHDLKIAIIVVAIQTAVTFISIPTTTLNSENFAIIALSVCAFSIITFMLTSLKIFVLAIITGMILAAFVVATVILAVFAIKSFIIKNAKENFWLCFIAAMPLGIGTVIGGIIMIVRGVYQYVYLKNPFT